MKIGYGIVIIRCFIVDIVLMFMGILRDFIRYLENSVIFKLILEGFRKIISIEEKTDIEKKANLIHEK